MYSESEDADKAREMWSKVVQISPDSAEGREASDNLRNLGQL
jgi:hypothetical protein